MENTKTLISSKFTDNLGRRPQKCTPPLAYGNVKIQLRMRRPLPLLSRSDTHLASCTEMHAQPRVPNVPVLLCTVTQNCVVNTLQLHRNACTATCT